MADPAGSLQSGVRACVSLAASEISALERSLELVGDADIVEIRWDRLRSSQGVDALARLVERTSIPILLTCRPAWQRGGYTGSEGDRAGLLESALRAGARWVDVELDAPFAPELVASHRDRVVLSHHWDAPRPTDLDARVQRILEMEPAIGKLVAPADRAAEAIPLLAAGERLRAGGVFPAAFCMGKAGRASRLLGVARSGGLLYVSVPQLAPTDPGQWTLAAVRSELRIGRWQPGQEIFGLIGHPIDHSLSPAIFNAAFAAAGRPACYLPIPGVRFEDVLEIAEASGVAGLSVTMPFKREAAAHCRRLEGLAQRTGAANTLVRTDEGWVGHNTDGGAVVDSLAVHRPLEDARVLIVGAGGAARSAVAALVEVGARVVVANRTAERAESLAREFGCESVPLEAVPERSFDGLVNATPVGMDSTARTPVSTAGLRGDEVVLEMIYRPAETELLREARAVGCTLVPGVEMFVRQAGMQHRIWTGEQPPPGSLRKAAAEQLEADRLR